MQPIFSFYHIEKCGGTSLRKFFMNYFRKIYSKDELLIPQVMGEIRKTNLTSIDNIQYIKDNFGSDFFDNVKVVVCHMSFQQKGITDFKSKINVTCLREPIERLISHYYFFSSKNYNDRRLDELTDKELTEYCKKMGNLMTNRLSGGTHDIDLAIKNISQFDVVMILEDINHSMNLLNKCLEKEFKVKVNGNLGHANKCSKKPTHSKELKNKLREYCKDDIKLYEHCKNQFIKSK